MVKIPSQPHLIIWSCFSLATPHFPLCVTFKPYFSLTLSIYNSHSEIFYIIGATRLFNPSPWEEVWRFISLHVDCGIKNLLLSRLAVSAYALLFPNYKTPTPKTLQQQLLLISLIWTSRASLDPIVAQETPDLLTKIKILPRYIYSLTIIAVLYIWLFHTPCSSYMNN